ncbi:MAG: hypothetical protein P4L33_04085 [Capsulimonadaceae bacterium]|nr:hypothetical protein [Capsulimonadaceae bacterium]
MIRPSAKGCALLALALQAALASTAFAQTPTQSLPAGAPPPGAHKPDAPVLHADNRVYLENADLLRLDESNTATATGNVRVRYRGYRITSDNAVIDPTSNVAVFSGNVHMWSEQTGLNIRTNAPATTIAIDVRRGTFVLRGSETSVIPPEGSASTGLLLPLYMTSDDMSSEPDYLDARDANITTCDFTSPHYTLLARTAHIRPGKRLVARHVDIYRRKKRLITLPIVVLSLDDRYANSNYLPQVGESSTEGYFAKFAIPYALSLNKTGLVLVDYMQKKGTGYGVDQEYIPPFATANTNNNTGRLKLYYLNDKSIQNVSTSGTLTQSEMIAGDVKMSLDAEYQKDSYLLTSTHSQTSTDSLDLNRSNSKGSTDYSVNYSSSNYGSGLTQNSSQALTQQWNTFHQGSAKIRLNLSDTSAAATSTDLKTLTSQTILMSRTGGYQWQFQLDRNFQLANTSASNPFTTVERRPELSVMTDSTQPAEKSLVLRLLPFLTTAGVVYGEYNDPSAGALTKRAQIDLDMDGKVQKFRSLTTSYSGDFEQDFYGDNTARYILSSTYGETYGLGRASSIVTNYQYARQYGYSPFVFDQVTDVNTATATLALQQHHSIGLNLQTGFDFTRATEQNGIPAAPWQNLSAQLVLRPFNILSDRISPVYDINSGQLVSLTDDFKVTTPWGFNYLSTTTYDTNEKIISSITNDLTLPIVTNKREEAGYSLHFLDGYNGYTKTITYYGVNVTRSWHDYELSAIFQQNINSAGQGNVFYLMIHLKAFPAYQPFGVSNFGQGVSTGSGQVF